MKKNSLFFGLVALCIALIMSIIWYDGIYRIMTKLVYAAWWAGLSFKAFDQRMVWALFSIFVLIIAGKRIVKSAKNLYVKQPPHHKKDIVSHLEKWTATVHPSLADKKNHFSRWMLAENLFALYAGIAAERFGMNQQHFKKSLEQRQLDIPEKIRAFLQAGYTPYSTIKKKSLLSKRDAHYPLDLELKEIVKHLEAFYGNDPSRD